MSAPHDDELPTVELDALEAVTGGAGDVSAMLPMMMMMRSRRSQAAPPPAAPATPKVLLNGVEQRPTQGPDGLTFKTET